MSVSDILSSDYFTYNGISSADKNLLIISINSGLFEETFLPNRTINEVTIKNGKRLYQSVTNDPLQIDILVGFKTSWVDDTTLRDIASWLNQDYYYPLIFSNSPNKAYYAIRASEMKLLHNGNNEGYLILSFRCDCDHGYSSSLYTSTKNVGTTSITITNNGDMSIFPEVYIDSLTTGVEEVSILNTTTSVEFEFTELDQGENERIYVDNEGEYIEFLTLDSEYKYIPPNASSIYRFDNFNNNWLELVPGENVLTCTSGCKIVFQWRCHLY